jgi:hypothetical protein
MDMEDASVLHSIINIINVDTDGAHAAVVTDAAAATATADVVRRKKQRNN